ncbi:MAG: hypothetical protein IJZ11_09460 [Bacteroidaceae bacterium]|nr:hypothetical protein [Bacteroidaceae bacterium]
MTYGKLLGASITGILFALFMWIGDEFVLDDKNPFYVYIVYALVFAVAMFLYDKFFGKKK